VSPPAAREIVACCWPFLAVDSTFLKGRFQQILLLAVSIDSQA
jgi:hypothetical protein